MMNNQSGITFASASEAAQFRRNNALMLDLVTQRVEKMPGVDRAEVWLNQFSPSFVAGYDEHDNQIVRIRLTT